MHSRLSVGCQAPETMQLSKVFLAGRFRRSSGGNIEDSFSDLYAHFSVAKSLKFLSKLSSSTDLSTLSNKIEKYY